jgi:hypothetical protein
LKYAFVHTLIYHPKFSLVPILHANTRLILIPRKIADHSEVKTSPYNFISFLKYLAISSGQMNARDSGLEEHCKVRAHPGLILRNDFPSYHAYY